MMWRGGFLILATLVLAACSQNRARVVSSPYADGVRHSEPVFYNGKHYKLRFKYQAHLNTYAVNVAGSGGRRLGGKPGDQKIVSDMVSSALRHFTCAQGQKAFVLPGTAQHANGSWNMQARCG